MMTTRYVLRSTYLRLMISSIVIFLFQKWGVAIFVLYFIQCALGAVIHWIKPKNSTGRPAQNYIHAVLGLLIIALALYQVRTGFKVEWPKTTGRGELMTGATVVWYIWVVVRLSFRHSYRLREFSSSLRCSSFFPSFTSVVLPFCLANLDKSVTSSCLKLRTKIWTDTICPPSNARTNIMIMVLDQAPFTSQLHRNISLDLELSLHRTLCTIRSLETLLFNSPQNRPSPCFVFPVVYHTLLVIPYIPRKDDCVYQLIFRLLVPLD